MLTQVQLHYLFFYSTKQLAEFRLAEARRPKHIQVLNIVDVKEYIKQKRNVYNASQMLSARIKSFEEEKK